MSIVSHRAKPQSTEIARPKKMVTILASYTVTPNQETPKGTLWLSDSDQAWRWSHTPLIYTYKGGGKPHYDVTQRMRDSLGEILVHYYPLASRLSWIEGGRLKLDCNTKGAILLEAESTKALAEYGDFSPKEPIKELIPAVDYSQPIEELPLLLVQVTRFDDDEGGVAIGVAVSHPLCDGLATTRFINSWAKLARGDALGPDEMPFLDRTVLKPSLPPSAPRFDHPELKPMPLKLGSTDNIAEQKKKTTFALLKLTPEQVETLKKRANNEQSQCQKQGSRPYSRYEAISAHIWRCASKARELDEDQPTVVKFNVDIRNRLNPPLPQNYFGNALAATVTPICCAGGIISKPLSYAAQKIREAVEKLANEYMISQLDFIASQERMDPIRTPYFERGEHRPDVLFFGNPNLILGSWMSMPVYEADFGWGRPVHFGPGAVCPYDRGTIALSPDGDGSIVVFMHFQEAHMQQFIKFFWEDIQDRRHKLLRGRVNLASSSKI